MQFVMLIPLIHAFHILWFLCERGSFQGKRMNNKFFFCIVQNAERMKFFLAENFMEKFMFKREFFKASTSSFAKPERVEG